MKSATEIVKGKIVDISETGELTIKARCDTGMLMKRNYQECLIQMVDSRPLSNKQRRSCYALLREISDFTGMSVESSKEWLKLKFVSNELDGMMDTFSLSDAPMSLVAAFQRFLIRLILEYDVPCSVNLLEFVDDINDYMYACLSTKHCCVCGKEAGILMHGDKAIAVCEEHEKEATEKGFDRFSADYHLGDGIALDKHLRKIWFRGDRDA